MEAKLKLDPARKPVCAEPVELAARRTLKGAAGWIDWDDVRDCPGWCRGAITLDGRFTVDELRALLQFADRRGR